MPNTETALTRKGSPGKGGPHIRERESPMSAQFTTDIGISVCAKLGLTSDMLNSMYTAVPVGGFLGSDVTADIMRRFGLVDDEALPLGAQLAERGILTDDEAEWFDDAE